MGMRELKRDLWPYKVKITGDDSNQTTTIELWLGEHLGAFKDRWNMVCMHSCTDFYFRNAEDLMWFKLKWQS
jgi:hypothetical protein